MNTISYDIDGPIATITLDRPDKLNSFTTEMMHELIDVLNEADADDAVRAIIFTGRGRGFCAGADLSAGEGAFDNRVRGGPLAIEDHRDGGGLLTLRLFDMSKPLIAAINGPAVGVGITMTLPMDIRLAVPDAKIGFVFARRGLVPEACSSWFLPRVVGISKAAEWVYSGKVFPSQEAHAAGLISELVEPDQLLDRSREIATEIATNTSAISVALSRHLLWKMLGADHPMEAHRVDSKIIFWAGQNADVAEGVTSFLEKRPPAFPMKVSEDMPDFYPWWTKRNFKEPGGSGG